MPESVWRLDGRRIRHPGLVVEATANVAYVVLCTEATPGQGDKGYVVSLACQPFTVFPTFVYFRVRKAVFPPPALDLLGHLDSVIAEDVLSKYRDLKHARLL